MLGLRTDRALELQWSAPELLRRSRLAAWRLRAAGLLPGDRLLTWSPCTPQLPAVYWGAMRAGLVLVPLDLRMASDVLRRIAVRAETTHLAIGTGLDAPDPEANGLGHLTQHTLDELTADPEPGDPALPPRLGGRAGRLADAGPRPGLRDHLHVRHHVPPERA